MGLKQDKIGERYKTNEGYTAIIVDYINKMEVYIIFEGFENIMKPKRVQMSNLRNGYVKNEFHRNLYNVGYLGQGKYKTRENGKLTKCYKDYSDMMARCYNKERMKEHLTYEQCFVNEEAHCFQDFAEWWHNNYYEIEGERMAIDKDILCKGNKEYSFDKMIFVPQRINTLFVRADALRGDLPIGVCYEKKVERYRADCNTTNGHTFLGYYNSPEEAFLVYKEFKEAYIKEVADEYKDKIPQRLYDAMYAWKVEIDD